MDREEQIQSWYSNIQSPTDDDRADFEVMLMDIDHPSDASNAVQGIIVNILQNGFRDNMYSLLLLGAKKENASAVKARSLTAAIFIASAYDDNIRRSPAIQEQILDLLAEQQEEALYALCRIGAMRKHMIIMGNVKNIRQTLIYKLIVVGEEANQMFDQSC